MPRKMNINEKVAQLRRFYQQEERVPGYAEMLKLFNYRSKNAVHGLIKKLVELGYVRKDRNGKIALTSRVKGGLRLLGSVQAGFPLPAEEELVDTITGGHYYTG